MFGANQLNMSEISNLAVLLVDIQDGFLDKLYEKDREILLQTSKKMLNEAVKYQIPVVVVETKFKGSNFGNTSKELEEIYSQTTNKKVNKVRMNSFLGTSLDYQLSQLGSKNILIAGMNASECIKETIQGGVPNYNFLSVDGLIHSKKEHIPQGTGYQKHNEGMRWIKQNIDFYKSI